MFSRWTTKAAVLGAVAAGAAIAFQVLTASGATPRSGLLRVSGVLEKPPGAYVRGSTLVRGRARSKLGAQVSGPLMGSLAPVAVPSADARYVAYSTWARTRELDPERSFSKQGIRSGDALGAPSLRVFDQTLDKDVSVMAGAYSAAWRGDGSLAYVRGLRHAFAAGEPYLGHVVVRSGVHGRDIVWSTKPGRYVVYGWAGSRLVAYRIGEGENLDLLVFDGPGRARNLSPGSLIALSPDGEQALVLAPDHRQVRLLEVATGAEGAALDLSATDLPVEWAAYGGSWAGDRVVAPASAGLIVFRLGAQRIEVEQVLAVDRDLFPAGLQEPVFSDDSSMTVTAVAELPPQGGAGATAVFVSCDRISRACERGEPAPATEWPRVVVDPSRPERQR
jgi:hypothetical protein